MTGAASRSAGGFTLFEMLIVLAILGLVAGLVLTHGPPRSATLDLKSSASALVQGLRAARSRAIATHEPQQFQLDPAARSFRTGEGAPHMMPSQLDLAMVSATDGTERRIGAITFAADGTSSGGRIELRDGSRHMAISVDWLTGRVGQTDGR